MKAPQLVVCESDGWLAKQVRVPAADRKWLVRECRQLGAAKAHLDGRPTVLFVLFDPHKAAPDALTLIAEVHAAHPDTAVVAVSDAKLPEEDRAVWAATALDLGARFVLFPPLTRPVLEDLAGGLLGAVIRRVGGPGPAAPPAETDVIDLAAEDDDA
jgi:hypothetical protein